MTQYLTTIHDVCDYTIHRLTEGRASLTQLKLQKLLYYIQAWNLAFRGLPLFKGKFQAWVHGPVSREIYNRFSDTKDLYSAMLPTDIRPAFDCDNIPVEARAHADNILEAYAKYSGTQLEEMTHEEDPWKMARKGYADNARCENEIDEMLMASYYKARVN